MTAPHRAAAAALPPLVLALLASCGAPPPAPTTTTTTEAPSSSPSSPAANAPRAAEKRDDDRVSEGGYYLDDGPPDVIPPGADAAADAIPKAEKIIAATTRPYAALGRRWLPHNEVRPHRERGIASWYGRRYHGRPTASGEIYDMFKMTAAHPVLAIPSYARVTRTDTGESVVVRINDRGPFLRGRVIDLSFAAARRLRLIEQGAGEVVVESIIPGEQHSAAAANSGAGLDAAPASPPAESASSVAADAAGGEFVYIQLGAFADANNAEKLRRRLRGIVPSELRRAIVRRDDLYLLLVGPYADEKAAGADDAALCAAGWCGFLTRAP